MSLGDSVLGGGLCVLAACPLSGAALAQSMSGISVGDPFSTIPQRIGFAPSQSEQSGPFTIVKWVLADGNSLSVTARSDTGRVVFVETDWGKSTTYTDFRDFYFGTTTLADIANKVGTDNFAFDGGPMPDGSIVMRNSYRISPTDVIVTFVTKLREADLTAAERSKINERPEGYRVFLKLDAIMLGDFDYLSSIWGREHLPASNARKVPTALLQPPVTSLPSQVKIIPLKDYLAQPNIEKDPAALGYLAARCSALYSIFAANLIQETEPDRKKLEMQTAATGEKFLELAASQMMRGTTLNAKDASQRQEDVVVDLAQLYTQRIAAIKLRTNNMFDDPLIAGDFNTCKVLAAKLQ
jgi:hypothetical protein